MHNPWRRNVFAILTVPLIMAGCAQSSPEQERLSQEQKRLSQMIDESVKASIDAAIAKSNGTENLADLERKSREKVKQIDAQKELVNTLRERAGLKPLRGIKGG